MNVVEIVGKTGQIIEIKQCRRLERHRIEVEHMHRSAAGAEMDARIGDFEIVVWIEAVDGEMARCLVRDRVFHQTAWNAQSSALVNTAPSLHAQLNKGGDRGPHSHIFQ